MTLSSALAHRHFAGVVDSNLAVDGSCWSRTVVAGKGQCFVAKLVINNFLLYCNLGISATWGGDS